MGDAVRATRGVGRRTQEASKGRGACRALPAVLDDCLKGEGDQWGGHERLTRRALAVRSRRNGSSAHDCVGAPKRRRAPWHTLFTVFLPRCSSQKEERVTCLVPRTSFGPRAGL